MLHTSAYDAAGSHTSLDALVAEVRILSQALRDVNTVAENDRDPGDAPVSLESTGQGHRNLPSVPRDLVQYVEAGRNPDIYTREFVELVRRTNQLRAGKRGAFAQFRDTLAGQIRSALPELGGDVDRIMGATAETGGGVGASAASTAVPTSASVTSFDGSKTTVVGDGETLGPLGNSGTTAAAAALASQSLSASASPSAHPGSGSNQAGAGTPSGNSDAGSGPNAASGAATTIDMMGILPSTPQPISAAGGGAGGGSGAGGAGEGGSGGQDAMETS